ncbi:hypothetical protein J2Y63_002444 [Shinella sp. BE166]|uniref:hypothetical protein n=1 Tax=Shinella sp. BE166 TaxID=3373918 RepID=UPI003EC01140
MNTIIRRVVNAWILWRIDRRLYRANPKLRTRRAEIKAARKSHKSTKPLLDEQQREMLRMLRSGL